MLSNVFAADELRSLARRKSKDEEFKSVRNALVEEEIKAGWKIQRQGTVNTRLVRNKAPDRLWEDRVWSLMYRMGFGHLSGEGGAKLAIDGADHDRPTTQIDVVGVDEEISLAIECKSSPTGRKYSEFSKDLGKHVSLRDRFTKSVREQFPIESKRPSILVIWTSDLVLSENDHERAAADRVFLLDERDLDYYQQLVDQIGTAARYQFLAHLLEGRQIPGLEITIPAIRARIGGSFAYVFAVSPEYLLKIAFVSHRAKGKASDIDAYQRLLKKSRLKSIREYIDEDGIFPTNIVVNIADRKSLTFDKGKQEGEDKSTTFGWLTIRPHYHTAWIIDGQHRLFGFADHPKARKSLLPVMAFVGLEASEQARLFVDINAEQRKVKQSLLQELYAELHWDSKDPQVRVQAILSKSVQALDTDPRSPLKDRILKADDARSEVRCISLTSVFNALDKSQLFIQRIKQDQVVEFGPFWATSNDATLKRTTAIMMKYFEFIRDEASELWARGSGDGGGLAMNDGVTVCINVLKSVIGHLSSDRRKPLGDLETREFIEVLEPLARQVGRYFGSLSTEEVALFRSLRGVQGQTAGTRRVEQALHKYDASFTPPGLKEFLEREKSQTTTKAFEEIQAIERMLQKTLIAELKDEFGKEESKWWFEGVPKSVRKKVDDRVNEEGGKKGGREQNFDLIDYREVIADNWGIFEETFARGKGNKDARTKWIAEVNEMRKPVMHASKGHSLPITEEQLAYLKEVREWLEQQTTSRPTKG